MKPEYIEGILFIHDTSPGSYVTVFAPDNSTFAYRNYTSNVGEDENSTITYTWMFEGQLLPNTRYIFASSAHEVAFVFDDDGKPSVETIAKGKKIKRDPIGKPLRLKRRWYWPWMRK